MSLIHFGTSHLVMGEVRNMTDIPQTNIALTKLRDIEDEILVQDMNYEFHYKRVINPDNNPTDLFNLFYREQSQETWITCNGLLSEDFTVAKTEDVIQQIRENLDTELLTERHFRSDTSVKSKFTLGGFELEGVESEASADKLIFQLVTNLNLNDVVSSYGMSFSIINGFSGNHKLKLSYGLMMDIFSESQDKKLSLTNELLLDEFTISLIHDQNMSVTVEQVGNVRDNITSKIEHFKGLTLNVDFFEELAEKMPKKFMKLFASLWDDLPEQFRNFYYATFLWGVILEKYQKISLEIKLRNFISAYMQRIGNV